MSLSQSPEWVQRPVVAYIRPKQIRLYMANFRSMSILTSHITTIGSIVQRKSVKTEHTRDKAVSVVLQSSWSHSRTSLCKNETDENGGRPTSPFTAIIKEQFEGPTLCYYDNNSGNINE